MLDDLDDLRIGVTGRAYRLQVFVADMAPRTGHLGREAHRSVGLRVVRSAAAVGGDFSVVEFGQVLAQVGMRRQAVGAAVDLGDGQGDALARRRRQGVLGQRAGHAQIALERGRAGGHQAEQVGHRAELPVHGLQQGTGGRRGGFDVGGDGDACHGSLLIWAWRPVEEA